MKLSEAIKAGLEITRPLRNGFARGGLKGGIIKACPIGAACYAVGAVTPSIARDLDSGAWVNLAAYYFPELKQTVTYTIPKGVWAGHRLHQELYRVITELVDLYSYTREPAVEAVQQMGY